MIEIDGEGPTILFVHGLGGTSNSFQALLGALDGFRCVRPDLPGSGRSPTPASKLTLDGFVETIGEVIRVIGAAPVHLVAHSMGTTVCQHVAVKMPEWVTSLTLFGPIHEPSDTARQRLKDRARAARQEGMIGIADAVAGGLPSATKRASPLVVPFLRESHMRQDAEGFAQSCEALADAQAADLRLLRCPMLLVTGDEDTVAPPSIAQAIADKVEGATVKVLERCGHWTPVERPQDCARLLSEHVRGTRRLMI
jgi:pimeloyl-ACP methyl ester carboxylesterase